MDNVGTWPMELDKSSMLLMSISDLGGTFDVEMGPVVVEDEAKEAPDKSCKPFSPPLVKGAWPLVLYDVDEVVVAAVPAGVARSDRLEDEEDGGKPCELPANVARLGVD